MKKIVFGIFVLIFSNVYGQELSDNFRIGDYIEVYSSDSIKINFNCSGMIVDKRCALYTRKGKIDSVNINLSGEFVDYYTNGRKAFVSNIENNYLNGEAIYYFKNGKIKSTGKYKNGVRSGIWKYFYKNGNLEKIINFVDGSPLIAEYYKKNGIQLVKNGNGEYKGEFKNFKTCSYYTVKGFVKNGKMDGKWTIYASENKAKVGDEYFENGRFVKGESKGYTYNDKQIIFLKGYVENESLELYDNYLGEWHCPRNKELYLLTYNGVELRQSFFPFLLKSIHLQAKNQWIIVGLKISKENELIEVNVKSSINDKEVESYLFEIISSIKTGWNTSPKENMLKNEFNLFFSILLRNNEIIIPAEFLYRKK